MPWELGSPAGERKGLGVPAEAGALSRALSPHSAIPGPSVFTWLRHHPVGSCSGSPENQSPCLPSPACCTVGKSSWMSDSNSFYFWCSSRFWLLPSVEMQRPLGDDDSIPSLHFQSLRSCLAHPFGIIIPQCFLVTEVMIFQHKVKSSPRFRG